MKAFETVAMREILDASSHFAAHGNIKAALMCQTARTKEDVENIIEKYGTNLKLDNALRYLQ